jgi:hypothetical protein
LRFADARDVDDLTNPVFARSDILQTTTVIETSSKTDPEGQIGKSKAATA